MNRKTNPQTDVFEIPVELVKRRRPFRVLYGVLLLVLIAVAAGAAYSRYQDEVPARFAYEHQLDHGEGLMLALWRMQENGQSLYNPIDQIPWVVNNYPPLFTWLVAWAADTPTEALLSGRRFSLVASFVSALMITFCVLGARRGGQGIPCALDVLSGLAAGFLFLILPDVLHWGSLMRVDMPALAFSVTGMAFVCMAGRRKTWPVMVAAVFFVLTLLTKHSLIAAPVALVIGCLPYRRRRAMRFSFFFALAAGILFLLGWQTWGGEMGFQLIRANRTAWSAELGAWHVAQVWHELGWACLFAVFGVFISLGLLLVEYTQKGRTPRLVLAAYLLLAAVGLFMTGKSGSSSNYYLEFFAALAINLGLLLADLAALPGSHCGVRRMARVPVLGVILTAALMMATGFAGIPLDALGPKPRIMPSAETGRGLTVLTNMLAQQDGPILSQDMSLAPLAGKDLLYHPFLMPDLARRGLWKDTALVRMIENHEFPVVFLSFRLDDKARLERESKQFGAMFTNSTLRAIRDHYRLDRVLPLLPTSEQLVVYLPRK